MTQHRGWIGVDLDGTLAEYDGWQGIDHIGAPIPPMQRLVKFLLRAGADVRIFTARMQEPDAEVYINAWSLKHFGRVLPATNRKDFGMALLLDDRAYRVGFNTGEFAQTTPTVMDLLAAVGRHWKGSAPDPEVFSK